MERNRTYEERNLQEIEFVSYAIFTKRNLQGNRRAKKGYSECM